MPRPQLVVDGQTNADAAYMNNEIIAAIGDLLKLRPELGDGATESILDVLNKFAGQGYFNLLLNSDFSNFDQQGNLLKWTAFASTVLQVTTATDNSLGHDFVNITADGSGANAGIKQTTAENSLLSVLLPRLRAQQLTVSLKVKVRGTVPVSVAINDTVEQSAGSGAWEEVVVKRAFTGTESDFSIQIYIPGTANTSAVSFDVGEAVLVVGEAIPAETVSGLSVGRDPVPNTIPLSLDSGVLSKGWTPFFTGFKNRIINGDFAVWQRGTSFSSTGYTADRWRYDTDTDDAVSIAQQATAGTEPFVAQYFCRVALTAGTTGTQNKFSTRLEFPKLYFGKTYTLSFWAKADVATTLTARLAFVFSGTEYDPVSASVSIGTSWQRYSVTFTLSTPTGFTESGSDYLDVALLLPINTTITIDVANVQLEEGDTATDFEHTPFEVQLLRCMRYYEKSYSINTLPGTITRSGCYTFSSPASGTGLAETQIFFAVPKRALPTLTIYSPDSGNPGYLVSGGADRPATVDYVSTTSFRAYWNDTATTKNNSVFHWVAEAEL